MRHRIEHLEIILKISERCNINCAYCYVFNKGNSAADESPPLLSNRNIQEFARFLEEADSSFDIANIQIDLHGGEPLMMKKKQFAQMCEHLIIVRPEGRPLSIALQTNGILIDDEWIDIFGKYNVYASISIDGDKRINDQYRLDKKGRSTYEDTVRGLRRLQDAYRLGKIPQSPGLLSVINPNANGAAAYRHFVDELKVDGFDFLIPDDTYNDVPVNNQGVGQFLVDALDEWVKDDNPRIRVRLFHTHLGRMLGAMGSGVLGHNPSVAGAVAFTVGSDGVVRVDDTLRSTSDSIFAPIGHVSSLSLQDVLASPAMQEYAAIGRYLPDDCGDCVWNNVCSGGRLVNRYSPQKRFHNKTVYCDATRRFLGRAAAHLLNMGFPEEQLSAAIAK